MNGAGKNALRLKYGHCVKALKILIIKDQMICLFHNEFGCNTGTTN